MAHACAPVRPARRGKAMDDRLAHLPVCIMRNVITDDPAGLRVLVADDSADQADSTALLVQSWGHTAKAVYNGAEALRKADAFHPDVILMDIGMPEMDGYELAKEIRRRDPDHEATLIAVTAYGDESFRQLSRQAGIDLHLVKPVDPLLLAKALTVLEHAKVITAELHLAASRNELLRRQTQALLEELRETTESRKSA